MGAKVQFDEINKIINITLAPDVNDEVFIDVKEDLYSDGKEDWIANENLRKFYFPISAVGGNPLPGSKALGSTFFLASDWKIRPYNASHRLIINGNLYSEDGSDPFLDTIGTFTVRIMQQVSSLVDSTVQQLAEIEFGSYGGGVTVDLTSPYSGNAYPIGTPRQPVNNFTDALIIASIRGFTVFYVIGDATVDSSGDYRGMIFVGESQTKSELDIDSNAQVDGCEFYDATVLGVLDGDAKLKNCTIGTLNYINGIIEQCLLETGTIMLGGNAEAHFLDCWSGVAGPNTPIIDMGGSGQQLSLRNYNGGIKITNKTGVDPVSIDLNSGHIILDSTVDITDDEFVIRGMGKLTDNSTGAGPNIQDFINPSTVSNAVWSHGTALEALGLVQKNFKMDQQIYEDYNGANLLTSARIRTYNDSALTDLLATYTVTATWSLGQCTSYQMVKI